MQLFAELNVTLLPMQLLYAAVFGAMGIVFLMLGYKIFEWITPKFDVEDQLQKGNVAAGIAVAGLLVAIALIMAAAIHG
jgi:putative membrane protein